MKALKDCKWKVNVRESVYKFGWRAFTKDYFGAYYSRDNSYFRKPCLYKTKSGAKRSWINFAKRNKFKHWEFV